MRRLCCVLGVLVGLGVAPTAHAGLSVWTPMNGLKASDGAQHVRDFQFESFPPGLGTKGYAATDTEGVFKTTSGGAAWDDFNPGLNDPVARRVRALLISGNDVYAGTELGLFKSDGGNSTWKLLAQGDDLEPAKKLQQSVESLVSVPGGRMLAGVFSGGVYRSDDDGKTWTAPAPGNGMPAHQTVNSIRYFPFVPGAPVYAASGTGIYRSLDKGQTWTLTSDGIPGGASPNYLWIDSNRPNIWYAGTGASGMYRSVTGGLTWSEINTGLLASRTRGLQLFTVANGSVMYAATEDGLWVGRTRGNSTIPPPPTWSKVTTNGLGNNTIMWALTAPSLPGPIGGTLGLFAGTQSNGGYALTFQRPDSTCGDPPSNTQSSCPDIDDLSPIEGQTLEAQSPGTWTGTAPIEFAYQWQRCTGNNTGCTDIPDETGDEYVVTHADRLANRRFRLEVTATNPFPTFDLIQRYSATTAATAVNPDDLPTQANLPTIDVLAPGQTEAPRVGDTMRATTNGGGWFNTTSALTAEFQWLRCSGTGTACHDIPGATGINYKLKTGDGTHAFRVRVTGTNDAGSLELLGIDSFAVISEQAAPTENPQLFGDPYPGETLTGTVGAWKDPSTGFERLWLRCDPDGTFCHPIQEIASGDYETGPSYTVRDEDVDYTLRMRVIADVNGDSLHNAAPDAFEIETAASGLIVRRPGTGSGEPPSEPSEPSGGGAPAVLPDALAPVLGSVNVTNKRFVVGSQATPVLAGRGRTPHGTTFRFRLSEPGSAVLAIDRLLPGRKSGRKCKAPSRKLRKKKKCTRTKRAGILTRNNLPAGANSVAFSGRIGKKKLAPGSYQTTIVATDGAGNRSRPAKVKFTVVRR